MGDRVLQLLGPSTGGIRQHVGEVTRCLRSRGWDVITAAPPGVLDTMGGADMVVDVPNGLSPRSIVRARAQLSGSFGIVDVVHAHGLKAGWLASTLADRPPLVVTVHNLVLREAAGPATVPLRVLEGRLPGRADQVIAVSDEIADRFHRPANLTVIPPAGPAPVASQDPSATRRALGLDEGDPLAVAVARLHPQKDLATFIRAVQRVDHLHAAIAGSGPLHDDLRRLTEQLGVAQRVRLLGQVASTADLMAAADVVVVSSIWESGPLALVEAMLLGRPVISTPVGLAHELVVDGETGLRVPCGDDRALSDAITWVLADEGRAAAMGGAGQRRATDTLGSDRLVPPIESVYRSAMSR